jgi:hypothetical protein
VRHKPNQLERQNLRFFLELLDGEKSDIYPGLIFTLEECTSLSNIQSRLFFQSTAKADPQDLKNLKESLKAISTDIELLHRYRGNFFVLLEKMEARTKASNSPNQPKTTFQDLLSRTLLRLLDIAMTREDELIQSSVERGT